MVRRALLVATSALPDDDKASEGDATELWRVSPSAVPGGSILTFLLASVRSPITHPSASARVTSRGHPNVRVRCNLE